MTLSFTTKINGMPNFFIEKIWLGLIQYQYATYSDCNQFQKAHIDKFMEYWDNDKEANLIKRQLPKLHTIREDEKNRWKPGMKIQFVINNRSKNRFQFAPVLQVVSIQQILIVSELQNGTRWNYVEIDGNMLAASTIERLAKNDGFNNSKEFFKYFCKYDDPESRAEFSGKIIHWTNLKY